MPAAYDDVAEKHSMAARVSVFGAVVAITLAFGLWPFKFFPQNDARCSPDGRCMELSGWSMAVPASAVRENGFCEIDVSVAPRSETVSRYIGRVLSLYDATTGAEWLLAGQWRSDFIVRLLRRDPESGRLSYVERGVDSLFLHKKPARLRIVYGDAGLSVRVDSALLFNKKGWRCPEKAAWIAGVSPFGTEPWPGSICLLSTGPLRAGKWTVLPRFKPPFRRVLETPTWSEIRTTGFMNDAIVNFFGFMPFGFFFALLFRRTAGVHPGRVLAAVLLVSLATTLFIELTQTTIPFRTSQLSDVIFNTIGGFIGGIVCIRFRGSRVKKLP